MLYLTYLEELTGSREPQHFYLGPRPHGRCPTVNEAPMLLDAVLPTAKEYEVRNQVKMHQLVGIIVNGVRDSAIVKDRRLVMRCPAILRWNARNADAPPKVVMIQPFGTFCAQSRTGASCGKDDFHAALAVEPTEHAKRLRQFRRVQIVSPPKVNSRVKLLDKYLPNIDA